MGKPRSQHHKRSIWDWMKRQKTHVATDVVSPYEDVVPNKLCVHNIINLNCEDRFSYIKLIKQSSNFSAVKCLTLMRLVLKNNQGSRDEPVDTTRFSSDNENVLV